MSRTDLRSRLAREEESWGHEEGGGHHSHRSARGRRYESPSPEKEEQQSHGTHPLLYGALALAAVTVAKREIPQLKRYLKIERM